jgi:hypothetical protein
VTGKTHSDLKRSRRATRNRPKAAHLAEGKLKLDVPALRLAALGL